MQLQHADAVLCCRAVPKAIAGEDAAVATGCQDGSVHVWSSLTGACLYQHCAHARGVLDIAPVPAAAAAGPVLITAGGDGEAHVLHVPTGQPVWTWRGCQGRVFAVAAFTMAECENRVIGLFGVQTGAIVAHYLPASVLSATPGSADCEPVRDADAAAIVRAHFGFVQSIRPAVPGDSSRILTAGSDGLIRTWSLLPKPGRCVQLTLLHSVRAQPDTVLAALPLTSTDALSVGGDGKLRVWDMGSWACRHVVDAHDGCALALHCNVATEEGETPYVVTGGEDGLAKVWHPATQALVATLPAPRAAEYGVNPVLSVHTLQQTSTYLHLAVAYACGVVGLWELELCANLPLLPASALRTPELDSHAITSPTSMSELALGGRARSLTLTEAEEYDADTAHDVAHGAKVRFVQVAGQPFTGIQACSCSDPLASSPATGPMRYAPRPSPAASPSFAALDRAAIRRALMPCLREFVAIPTVSPVRAFMDDCWRGARWLSRQLTSVGADVQLVQGRARCNPCVVARLGRRPNVPTIGVFGHYDVQPAQVEDAADSASELSGNCLLDELERAACEHVWQSPPFELAGRDGYVYGRGVSDNKGPLLCAMHAATELHRAAAAGTLALEQCPNFVFIVEGHGESGSVGFRESIQQVQSSLGPVHVLINTNSLWADDTTPCLTVAMRGQITMNVAVRAPDAVDVHSGTAAKRAAAQPMMDLCAALASLSSSDGKITVPEFYPPAVQAAAGPLGPAELPTLAIHGVSTSAGAGNTSVVPHTASATLSCRIVRPQVPLRVFRTVAQHLLRGHSERHSNNSMCVKLTGSAVWWHGHAEGWHYHAAAAAVQDVWGVEPVLVQEGGTQRTTPWLERVLQAPVCQVCIGQSSNAPHEVNERMRVENLLAGTQVLHQLFQRLAVSWDEVKDDLRL